MTPVAKAIWFIEAKAPAAVTLSDVAAFAGVTPHHLAHAFARVTGQSVIGYARRRRLSMAANALQQGATDILTVALDHGYASHEAFTRAFRAAFDATPEAARAAPEITLNLQERIDMTAMPNLTPTAQRYETYGPFSVAGLWVRVAPGAPNEVPQLWQRFGAYMGHVPGQRPDSGAIGLCTHSEPDGSFRYTATVEMIGATDVDAPLCRLDIAKAHYAVFYFDIHIAQVAAAWAAVMNNALPALGRNIAPAPCFEYYDGRFDPATGNGGFEIWVPVSEA